MHAILDFKEISIDNNIQSLRSLFEIVYHFFFSKPVTRKLQEN